MRLKTIIFSVVACFTASVALAEDIGFGTIKGIKVGHGNIDQIAVHLDDGYTLNGRNCNGVIFVRKSDISSERMSQITSVLLAAYMAGKKIRLHSHLPTGCNATFIAIQESYF